MPRPLKFTPIVIDYQPGRHGSAGRRKDDAPDEGPSGLFYLSVWTLSTGLFLLAFYVAAEAPFRPEGAGRRDPLAGSRPGLPMAPGHAPRLTKDFDPGPLAGSRPNPPR